MAKYQLPQYQSMYVDPQSVAINTELRSRFLGAFQADDALGSAVDAMDAADFDGDQAAKQRLAEQYNAQLDDRAARGDYETLGMAITRDARQFVQDYRPIQENKAEYDAWKAKVDASHESYNTGKGGLNNDEYLLMLEKGKHNYAGLQYDDDGNLIEDSRFEGQDFTRSVDELAELDIHLKGIEPDSYENLGIDMPLSDLVMNANGTVNITKSGAKDGEPVKYWVTNLNGTKEEISDDVVEKLARQVLNKPDVVAGMQQRADLNTFKLNDISEDGSGRTNAQVQIDAEIAELDAERLALMNKPVKSAEDEARLDAIDQELRKIESYRAQGGGGDIQHIKDDLYQQEYDEALEYATGKYAYERIRGGQKIRLDQEQLKKAVKTAPNSAADGLIMEDVARQYENPALHGDTKADNHVASTQNYVKSLQNTRTDQIATFNEALIDAGGTGKYTAKEILNDFTVDDDGRLIDPSGRVLAADASVLNGMQNMLLTNLENEQMATQLLVEAKREINYADRTKAAVENVTAEEIESGFRMPLFRGYEFDVDYNEALKKGTVTDMVDFYNQLNDRESDLHKSLLDKYGYTETEEGSGIYYTTSPAGLRVISARHLVESSGQTDIKIWENLPESAQYWEDENGNQRRYIVSKGGTAVDHLLDEINREASDDKEQIDKDLEAALEKRKDSKIAHSTQRWPGNDSKESERHQKLVTDYLKEGIPESFVMQVDGKMEEVTGGIKALGLKDAEITAVDWMPDPVTGEIYYGVTVKGKGDDDVTTSTRIFVNAEQIKYVNQADTDFLRRVQNNTAFQIEHKANKAEHSYGLESTYIPIQRIDENQNVSNIMYEYDFNNNKMREFTLNANGTWDLFNTYEIGSDSYYKRVNDPNIRISK